METIAYMDSYREVTEYSNKDAENKVPYPSGGMVDEVMKRLGKG